MRWSILGLFFVLLVLIPLVHAQTSNNASLSSTNSRSHNLTIENLTVSATETDTYNSSVKAIYNWFRNDTPLLLLNMPFEGATNSTNVTEYSSVGIQANVIGNPYWNSTGGYDGNGSYNFDGINDIIIVRNISYFNRTANFSIELWFRNQGHGRISPDSLTYIIMKGRAPTTSGYGIAWNHSANKIGFVTGDTVKITNRELLNNTWYHVVMTVNDTNVSIYIDGTLDSSPGHPVITTNTPNLTIGALQGAFGIWGNFNGTIDEVRIYNISLSPAQVLLLYQNKTNIIHESLTEEQEKWQVIVTLINMSGNETTALSNTLYIRRSPTIDPPILNSSEEQNRTTENLTIFNISTFDQQNDAVTHIISWYRNNTPLFIVNIPFEGSTNATFARDYSGRGFHGTGIGGTAITFVNSTGDLTNQFGYVNFTGTGLRYYNLSAPTTLDLNNDSFSIEFWVFPVSGQNNPQIIFGKSTNTLLATTHFRFEMRTNGSLQFFVGNTTNSVQANAETNYKNTGWHHVVGVRDYQEKRQYIYVDNTLRQNVSNTLSKLHAGGVISIGVSGIYNNANFNFNGSLASLRIWNTSLSSEQIQLLWQNRTDTIHNSMIFANETWHANMTANDRRSDGESHLSNNVTVQRTELNFSFSDQQILFIGNYTDSSIIQLPNRTFLMYLQAYINMSVTPNWTGYFVLSSHDSLTWQQETDVIFQGISLSRAYVFSDGTIRFYYPKQQKKATSPGEESPKHILSANSTTGLSFENDTGVRISPRENYTVFSPTIIQLSNGSYRMFFTERNFSNSTNTTSPIADGEIYGATSEDALSWQRDERPTIVAEEAVEGAYGGTAALSPFVVPWNEGYLMLYETHTINTTAYRAHSTMINGSLGGVFLAAYSPNGYNWTKLNFTGVYGNIIDGDVIDNETMRIYMSTPTSVDSGTLSTGILKIRIPTE